jgi:hypothetical protein
MMKKLLWAFCVLLATVSAFALEGIGDFNVVLDVGILNAGASNEDSAKIGLASVLSYSNAFGAFGLEASVGNYFEVTTAEVTVDIPVNPPIQETLYAHNAKMDKFFIMVAPSYSLTAGPGTLKLSMSFNPAFYTVAYRPGKLPSPEITFNPVINYSLDSGFGHLSFEAGTSSAYPTFFNKGGASEVRMSGRGMAFLGQESYAPHTHDYDFVLDDLYFKASLALPMGLSFWVSPRFFITSPDDVDATFSFMRFDVSYTQMQPSFVSFAIEGGIPTFKDGMDAAGVMLKPRVMIGSGAVMLISAFQIEGIGCSKPIDVEYKPSFSVLYRF